MFAVRSRGRLPFLSRLSREAPLIRRALSGLPLFSCSELLTARWSAVQPSQSGMSSQSCLSHPSRYMRATSEFWKQAQWSGVEPRLSLQVNSIPSCLKKQRLIGWSPCAAMCMTLRPKWFLTFTSAPLSTSNLHSSTFPLKEAQCKAVNLSFFVWRFTQAAIQCFQMSSLAFLIKASAAWVLFLNTAICNNVKPSPSMSSSSEAPSGRLRRMLLSFPVLFLSIQTMHSSVISLICLVNFRLSSFSCFYLSNNWLSTAGLNSLAARS